MTSSNKWGASRSFIRSNNINSLVVDIYGEQRHICTSNKKLRFKVGDRVQYLCTVGANEMYLEGIIKVLWPFNSTEPYLIQRSSDNLADVCKLDIDHCVRSLDFGLTSTSMLDRVHERLESFTKQKHIKTDGGHLLLSCASAGYFGGVLDLSTLPEVDMCSVDDKGRNILHLSVSSVMFVNDLHTKVKDPQFMYAKLIVGTDNDGRNVLHYCVLVGSVDKCLMVQLSALKEVLPLCRAKDSKGRSPLDYAVLFKKTAQLNVMLDYMIEEMVKNYDEDMLLLTEITDESCLEVLQRHIMLDSSLVLDDISRKQLFGFIQPTLINFLIDGYVLCVQWFFEHAWHMGPRLFQLSSGANFIESALMQCLSPIQHCDLYCHLTTPAEITARHAELHDQLFLMAESWDCNSQTFEQFLASKQIGEHVNPSGRRIFDVEITVPSVKLLVDAEGESLFQFWLDSLLLSCKYTLRRSLLEYLLDLADERHVKHPPLIMFVSGYQVPLFEWYVDRYWINLQERLDTSEINWQSAATLPWMLDANKTMQTGLTLCEFLCAHAACGAVALFPHLFSLCRNPSFTIHGLNMLQLAASTGNYLVVRYCLMTGLFSLEDVYANGINALHLAIRRGHRAVVMHLLPLIGNMSYAERNEVTPCHVVFTHCRLDDALSWAREEALKHAVADIKYLLEQCRFSVKTLSIFLERFVLNISAYPRFELLTEVIEYSISFGASGCEWFGNFVLWGGLSQFSNEKPIGVLEGLRSVAHAKGCPVAAAHLMCSIRELNSMEHPYSPITCIQSCYRHHRVQSRYRHYLGANHTNWMRFISIWGPVVRQISAGLPCEPFNSWSELQRKHAMVVFDQLGSQSEDEIRLTTITSIAAKAVELPRVSATISSEAPPISVPSCREIEHVTSSQPSLERVELTHSAIKWFDSADFSLRTIFLKRVTQLAEGRRSYALSKRLQHCDCPIFESKLDKGMRILWTKLQRGDCGSILIWFVCKHDDVIRCRDLIDASCKRQSTELEVVQTVGADAVLNLREEDVLIDPTGNCPLKAYVASRTEIAANHESFVRSWHPTLRLSGRQQQVNSEEGTVLLLGRSGTGKTLCLCDRMIADRKRQIGPVRQLFVCHSKRLCEFVRYYQQQHSDVGSIVNMHFMTLASFTSQMNINVKIDHGPSKLKFPAADKVDFRRFAGSILPGVVGKCGTAALVVWLQIRSFIKGSVEAVLQRAPLTIEQFTDLGVFGADRCRLSVSDRREVYALFLRYAEVLKTQGLWDDADYTLDLLTRSKLEPLSTQYDKVYVDEVQDNTQAEIVLYFLAAGMNTQSLFLAGDPAQSVVEGVDFRFEDVRSIVYKLSGGNHSVNRAVKLTINFRSHSGILNCAAAILDKMFAMFPGAANVLPKDVGLFKGPRPACCQVDGIEGLAKLLTKNERLVVLCADEDVEHVESELTRMSIKNTVLGIRAAKGLEFQDVVICDFCAHINRNDQAVWKSLLISQYVTPSAAHSHIELQLKLLYTAVTRSCNRLLFVETEKTKLSSVMFRWLVGAEVAEMHNAADESTVLMTSDEWRVQGIEFALSAEGEQSAIFLGKAVKCFKLAGDVELTSRAAVELDLCVLTSRLLSVGGEVILNMREEREAAQTVLRALRCGLRGGAVDVCGLLRDRVISCPNIFWWEVVCALRSLL